MTGLSSGASFQNSGIKSSICLRYNTPPITFFAPGYSPRSISKTFSPLRAQVRAHAVPEGPAPTTMTSNFSGITNFTALFRLELLKLLDKFRYNFQRVPYNRVRSHIKKRHIWIFINSDNKL